MECRRGHTDLTSQPGHICLDTWEHMVHTDTPTAHTPGHTDHWPLTWHTEQDTPLLAEQRCHSHSPAPDLTQGWHCNTTSWSLASSPSWGWSWIWCTPPWVHQHRTRGVWAEAPAWWHACSWSEAPGYTPPPASPQRWWPPSHNTPQDPPPGDTRLDHTTLLGSRGEKCNILLFNSVGQTKEGREVWISVQLEHQPLKKCPYCILW